MTELFYYLPLCYTQGACYELFNQHNKDILLLAPTSSLIDEKPNSCLSASDVYRLRKVIKSNIYTETLTRSQARLAAILRFKQAE
ncbi:hypothetical protein A0J61_07859 [Choanephora cucurbitarum]|uniref:Uncharacterized protein n=1 Tax=Choanephora cucurbitarum TaxID=101091 RepID=A0A1C7N9Q9_9FUNG|nr:hypothetical protein A0J61_07859 [Choanephora cucurbitarum]